MLKSKGRPVQGQISSKYCKIHLRGVVKVSVFTKSTLFGRTYRYPRAMFCSQWVRRLVFAILFFFFFFFFKALLAFYSVTMVINKKLHVHNCEGKNK